MGEDVKVDAESLANLFKEKIAKAEETKIIVPPDEHKMVDLDQRRSSEKWTVIGGSTVVPSDLEIAMNLSPEVSMIDLQGDTLEGNLFAIKVRHGGFQLKLLSRTQGLSVDTLDESDNLQTHAEFEPSKPGEQRHSVDLQAKQRAMVYLGPNRYPMRIFQRQHADESSIRMVFNPAVPK